MITPVQRQATILSRAWKNFLQCFLSRLGIQLYSHMVILLIAVPLLQNSQHSMTTLPSALWTDSYSQPPASKKSKSSPSPKEDSAIHSLEHLVSTIGTKLDEVKTNLCLLSSTSSDEGQSNTDLDQVHELSADQDLEDEIEYSDNEDCLFWVEAAQQISQLAESGEDQESETSKVFLNTEVAQPKQISSQLLLPSHPSTDQSNFTMHYSCHEIELKRLKAIHTLSQKNKFN